MEGLLNLFPLFTDNHINELDLCQFMDICKTHQLFSEKTKEDSYTLDNVVAVINSKLNVPSSRIEGALLLETFIPQCPTEIFTANCLSWFQQMIKLLQGAKHFRGVDPAYLVLDQLLEISSQFPELVRQLGAGIVSQLIGLLCDDSSDIQKDVMCRRLHCLKTCLQYFHSMCGQQKGVIESHLLTLVDSKTIQSDCSMQMFWASCMAFLPCLGGGGPQGLHYRMNWINYCSQLIQSLHHSINGLFRSIQGMQTTNNVPEKLKLEDLKDSNPLVLLQLEKRRFMNLCCALSQFLKEPFPTAKNVPVDQILNLTNRIMAVNCRTLSKHKGALMDVLALGSIIPDLHSSMLDVVMALVGACRSQLMTRTTTIMNMFIQVLQWTFIPLNERRWAVERPYGNIRAKAYNGLSLWLTASRTACGSSKFGDVLLSQLLSDIVLQRDTVQLQLVTETPSGRKGKKKTATTPNVIHRKQNINANFQVCRNALHCLSLVLLHCGSKLKTSTHKEIQETVLGILMELTKGESSKSLIPYNHSECRAALYKVLERLILCQNPHWPSPVHHAVTVLTTGLNDPSLQVSSVCAEIMTSIQGILRPRGPVWNFSLDSLQSQAAFQEKPLLECAEENELELNVQQSGNVKAVNGVTENSGKQSPQTGAPIAKEIQLSSRQTNSRNYELRATENSPVLAVTSATSSTQTTMEERIRPLEPDHFELVDDKVSFSVIEQTNARKRPLQNEATPSSVTSKRIINELPFGLDEESDVDSMLSTFIDAPADP